MLVLILIFMSLTGCTPTPDPLELFEDYGKAWEDMDYEKMYGSITVENQDTMTIEEFDSAYQVFQENMRISKIQIDFDDENVTVDEGIATVAYTVTATIPEGTISYSSQMKANLSDENTWAVDWAYSLIWEEYASGDNVHRTTSLPVRGELYDRNGRPMAHNGFILQVGIVPGRLGSKRNEMVTALASTFQLTEKFINDRLALPWVGDDTFVDIIKVPMDRLSEVKVLFNMSPGVTYREVKERVYPYGVSAGHLTGYMGYPTEAEMETRAPLGFTTDDKLGRTGLERYLNDRLEGNPGVHIAIRDTQGEEKHVLYHKDPVHGENITLHIDAELQQMLYRQMSEESGAAAVMNHQTGEVLALVSTPSYDPNAFILGMSASEYNRLETDAKRPLINRLANAYSPGSTFKAITAAAGLNSGTIDLNDSVNIQGLQWQKDASWGNHFITRVNEVNGAIDLEKGMVYSDNIYFARLAMQIGESTFFQTAELFGIGKDYELMLPMKSSQLANKDTIESDVLLADTGYGQGQVLANILTLPKAYSAFVNDGQTVEPVLIHAEELVPTKKDAVSKETADIVYKLLEKSITLPYATGYGAYIPGKILAGKTGTAEIPKPNDSTAKDELGWFVVLDKEPSTPYATVMMLENVKGRGGSGFTVAKVKAFIQAYSK
jgi:penicillin-binding protein